MPPEERARWLAEVASALNDAHRTLVDIAAGRQVPLEARELFWRIEAARLEVQSLRLSRSLTVRNDKDPKWIKSPWDGKMATRL